MSTDLTKRTQLGFILHRLEENGQVSRNDCLQHFITRLGSRIWDLKREGFEFVVMRKEGDYIYKLTKDPRKQLTQLALTGYLATSW